METRTLLKEAALDAERIAADRRALHAHPGTGFDIPFAVDYVMQSLRESGLSPQRCGQAGITALAGGKKPGRVFLLRADMDALPMQEASGVPFASEIPGRMHACGHDLHTAMLLEAARLLKRHEAELEGTVKLMFQPAEEIFQGSSDMVRAGVLENPHVDAALMIHVAPGMPFPAGTVIACDGGVSAAACDTFTVTVTGKGCHGSMPHQGIDPITPACAMVTALQEIPAREMSMQDEAALTVGCFQAGGAANVIPDTAGFSGTLRTFDEELRTQIKDRLEELVTAIGAAYRTQVSVSWTSSCPTLYNDPALAACIPGYLQELEGLPGCWTVAQLNAGTGKAQKGTGSEDFAYISRQVPSLMLALAAGTPADGYIYPQHHPQVRFDEACLVPGSAVYAQAAIRWLEEHGL